MPRFTRVLAAIAAIALIGGVATTATAASPEPTQYGTAAASDCLGLILDAGPRLKAKAGFRTECVGLIKLNGKWGVCIDYGLRGPNGKWGSGPISSINDKRTRERVTWLGNQLDDSLTQTRAFEIASAIKRVVSADFRHDWPSYARQPKVSPAMASRSDRWVEDSKAAGDVKTTAVLVTKPKPGGTGVIVVTTKGAGRPISRAEVKWSTAGIKVTSAAKETRSDGTAALRFTWEGSKALTAKAVVKSAASAKAVFSTPNSGKNQHLVAGGYTVKSTALVRFDSILGAEVTQDCSTNCEGKPPVTLTAEAAAKAATWQALVGGVVKKTLTLPAGKKASALVPGVRDGDRIAFRYRIGKGEWRTSKTTFTVVCPPWPTVTVVKTCVCKGTGTVTYTITKAPGNRPNVARFTVNGDVKTVDLVDTLTFTAPLAPGTSISLGFSAYDKPGGTELATGVLDSFTQN